MTTAITRLATAIPGLNGVSKGLAAVKAHEMNAYPNLAIAEWLLANANPHLNC